jgi:hypothetical protein
VIDTLEKLEAFVEEHRLAMLAQALEELSDSPENQEPDIWGTYHLNYEEQCDFNIYQPEDGHINITAYPLREVGDSVQVNTEMGGCLVANIKWEV